MAATIMVRVGAHAWYSYGASSTEKRDVRGSNAVQWAMIRAAIAAGRRRLRPARHHPDPRRRRQPRRADPVQGRHRRRGRRVRRRVGPAAQQAALQGLRPLHEEAPVDEPGPHRRRRAVARPPARSSPRPPPGWCRSPRATATASRSAGWPARPSGWTTRGWASTPSPSAPTRSCPRSPTGTTATCWCSRRGGRSTPPPTPALSPAGSSTRSAGPTTCPRCSTAQPDARFVLELRPRMRRHGMTAQELWAIAERSGSGGRLEGVALHLPLAVGRAPRRGRAAAHRPGRRRAPDQHRLGQPPHRRRARHAAPVRTPTSRSGRASAPTSGWATARRCGSPRACSTSTRCSAGTCSATAAAAPRATATCSWSAAAPPTASASSPPRARPG